MTPELLKLLDTIVRIAIPLVCSSLVLAMFMGRD
jgi:hypothetical protein